MDKTSQNCCQWPIYNNFHSHTHSEYSDSINISERTRKTRYPLELLSQRTIFAESALVSLSCARRQRRVDNNINKPTVLSRPRRGSVTPGSAVTPGPGRAATTTTPDCSEVELQTELREHFKCTENAPTRAFHIKNTIINRR